MADEKEVEIKFSWKNDDHFEMTAKEPDQEWHQVVRIEENGHIVDLIDHVEEIANAYTKRVISNIKCEMLTECAEEEG